jgi:hypothetical protein
MGRWLEGRYANSELWTVPGRLRVTRRFGGPRSDTEGADTLRKTPKFAECAAGRNAGYSGARRGSTLPARGAYVGAKDSGRDPYRDARGGKPEAYVPIPVVAQISAR